MLEGLFNPLHLLVLILVPLIIFGIPLWILFLLARWLDRRLQGRPGVRVSFVGVATGAITDVVLSSLLALPVVIYATFKYHVSPAHGDPVAVASAIHSSPCLYGLELAVGLCCSVLGGYIAASIAKHDELLNGLLSSFLCTAIGVYSILSGKDSQSVLVQMFLLVAAPASAFLGGYLRQSQKRMGRTLA